MKKLLLIFLVGIIAISGMSIFSFFEPKLLEDGKIKVSVGVIPSVKYGLLDILEVGISPFMYMKLGHNIGNIHYSFSYMQNIESYYSEMAWFFGGLGYYHSDFNLYGNVFYMKEEIWDWVSDDRDSGWIMTEDNVNIGAFVNLTIYNKDLNGDFSINGLYNHELESENPHSGAATIKIGSKFEFNWLIFSNIYLYGGLGSDFPYKNLADSLIILAGLETDFQLISK